MRNNIRYTIIIASSFGATAQAYALPPTNTFDDVTYVENPFFVRETQSSITKTLTKDFLSDSLVEAIHSPLSFLKSDKTLILYGNRHKFVVQQIQQGISTSGISKDICFKNFSKIEFSESSFKDKLLTCPKLSFLNNDRFCLRNIHSLSGTIANLNTPTSLTISGNNDAFFSGNSSTLTGSVGQGSKLNITKNKNFVAENNSAGYGGTFHYKIINIRDNDSVTFSSNTSTGAQKDPEKPKDSSNTSPELLQYGGGALSSSTDINITNNNFVIFDANTALTNGGAVYSKNLNINNNKSVVFTNNIGLQKGGAIYITSRGSCIISGSSGDIRFENNYSSDGERNAINLEKESSLALQAKSRYQVFLGDPISVKEKSYVVFNPKDFSSPNLGKIVFSISGDSSLETESSRTSKMQATVSQNDGVIYVDNNAIFSPLKFSQTGGWLIVGASGTISTLFVQDQQTLTNEDKNSILNISHLGIDVASILNSNEANGRSKNKTISPKIVLAKTSQALSLTADRATPSDSITLSGPIYLTDSDLLLYENDIRMGSSLTDLTLLQLGENTEQTQPQTLINGNIDVSQVDLNTQPVHYGYQGVWNLAWSNNTLKGSWIPNGEYVVSPERLGSIVANSIWGNYAGTVSFLKILHENNYSSNGHPHNKASWLHGISLFGITNLFKPHPEKFEYKSAGAAAKISAQSPQNICCGVAVAKMRGNTADENFSQKSKNDLLYGAVFLELPWRNRYISTIKSSLSYGNSKERLKSLFEHTLPSKELGTAEYRIHSIAGECFLYSTSVGNLPLPGIKLFPKTFPFIAVSAVGAKISGFKEQSSFPRNFSSLHHFLNLSIPVGVQLNKTLSSLRYFWSLDTRVTFSPDVYRKNPAIRGLLLFNNAAWKCEGENLSRLGFGIECSTKYRLLSWQLSANYSLHGRQSSMHHTANAGIQKTF
ncbi:polymorphic outer membrane protein middle domain-containing protein [Chlamydiifrater phoenicopteri]|uniref:polymorphic outer membrane protein middle domain-containing protein n=1 Tax=Chlamydiifrater phoenicopteri TaxID=2681469 RepID=UPI001BCB7B51|nr:polymorphic outer membrane protein middle domain-containing protein [Chlamydiifrater phoenicopteri]